MADIKPSSDKKIMKKMDIREHFFKSSNSSKHSLNPGGKENEAEITACKKQRLMNEEKMCETEFTSTCELPKTDSCSTSVTFNADIGAHVGKQIDDDMRMELLNHPWMPDVSFRFPTSGRRNLRFVLRWFTEFPWLAYSPSQDGAYCKYCSLFSTTVGMQSAYAGKLVKVPYRNWKDAKEDFRYHEKTKYHTQSLQKAGSFVSRKSGSTKSIDATLNAAHETQVEKNRENLKPMIKTAIVLARKGLSFRGHRDSGPLNLDETYKKSEGNFRSFLKFRAESGDDVLKNHLQVAGANATYISWQTQNEIIASFNKIILKKLVEKVNNAKYFSILCDETTDISNISQMSFCVRFMENENAREEFLQFIPVSDLTGKGLADTICQAMEDFSLPTSNLVGQGYDGARAMSGHLKGAQAFVRQKYPKALYVHCCSHTFNLSLSEGCSVKSIRNCMAMLESIYVFFDFPKRQNVLRNEIEEQNERNGSKKLKRMCPTRWIERHDSVRVFVELIKPVIMALECITEWVDRKAASDAQLLKSAIEKCDFLMSLYITDFIFQITLPLSVYLQKENIDLSVAVDSAMKVKKSLEEIRENAEENFSNIYKTVSDVCADLNIVIQRPRITCRQTLRDNVPSETSEEYYRRSVFIPFLENTIQSLDLKFAEHKSTLTPFQLLLNLEPAEGDKLTEIISSLEHLAEFYELESSSLRGEILLWRQIIRENNPRNAIEALKCCTKNLLPTIYNLLSIMATLPVTTCTAERSFSSLKCLKTYLRSTTGEERLNGLALMYIHENVSLNENEVLEELSKKQRRLNICL